MNAARLLHASILLAIALPVAFSQPASQSAPPLASDSYIGNWKLNAQKSPDAPPDQSIKFEMQGDRLKITFHWASNTSDQVSDYWGVMDRAGEFVQMTETNGKPMNDERRATRIDSRTILVDSRPPGQRVQYQVSSDGNTMTARVLTNSIMMNRPWPDLVFDRAP